LNNDIGLPLMVLELRDSHRAAVLEMGASAAGEIDYLAKIAAPHIGILTNAGPAHLEGFGSIAGVARAKGELFDALADDGIAIINHDDAYYSSWRERCGSRRVISFGLHPDADVRAEAIRVAENGCMAFSLCNGGDVFPVSLPMPGQHNVPNALAAAAAALAAGVAVASIQAGLLATRNVGGRLLSVTSASGAQLFDDSYNANPASLEAAITFLAAQPGETWLVLGDMGELGPESEQLHRDCGNVARDAGLSRVLCVGGLARAAAAAFGPGGRSFDSREELVAAVGSELKAGITVLVKGSRSMGMEKVVAGLAAAGGER
jgi:UDP-N-acetylmuramoyl-tripeptide--D-alanyl-D-alanine ligase